MCNKTYIIQKIGLVQKNHLNDLNTISYNYTFFFNLQLNMYVCDSHSVMSDSLWLHGL